MQRFGSGNETARVHHDDHGAAATWPLAARVLFADERVAINIDHRRSALGNACNIRPIGQPMSLCTLNPKYTGKAFQTYQAALTMMALGPLL
jgi:hypothetical protein